MDRRELSLTLSEDDLRRNNSRRQSPQPRESSDERLRARIRELLAEERNPTYAPPPRPVVPVTPMVVRRSPIPPSELFPPSTRTLHPALPTVPEQSPSRPYRRRNNQRYFDWDEDDSGNRTRLTKPAHVHQQSWDDPVLHSKDNCELCSLAKKQWEKEQEKLRKKNGGNVSRYCEDLREFQQEYSNEH